MNRPDAPLSNSASRLITNRLCERPVTSRLLTTKDLPDHVAAYVKALPPPVGTLRVVEAVLARIKPARKRKPTLISVAKQASKAAIAVARYEVKPDGTVVVITGKPEPVEPDNAWPLDEFRTKETKQ